MILEHLKSGNERPICEALTNITGKSKKCYWLRWDAGWCYCIIFNFKLCQSGQHGTCKQPGKWRVYYDAKLLRKKKIKNWNFCFFRLIAPFTFIALILGLGVISRVALSLIFH